MLLAGGPANQIAGLLEEGLALARPGAENWDTRAALLWVLVVAERFAVVEECLKPMLAQVQRCGSARGFVAVYSTLGLLKLRLGALPEADAAARVALRVLQEGDFAPGLGSRRPCWPMSLSRPVSLARRKPCLTCSRRKDGRLVWARCSSRPPGGACG